MRIKYKLKIKIMAFPLSSPVRKTGEITKSVPTEL
jgi:hypothetical protein